MITTRAGTELRTLLWMEMLCSSSFYAAPAHANPSLPVPGCRNAKKTLPITSSIVHQYVATGLLAAHFWHGDEDGVVTGTTRVAWIYSTLDNKVSAFLLV